jgi:hypothetical protein
VLIEGGLMVRSERVRSLGLRLHERSAPNTSVAGLPNSWWHDLNLFRKGIGGRQVAISFHEHSSDE